MDVEVEVWVCPTPGCGNYFASRAEGDLRQSHNREPNHGKATTSRAECPDCRDRGDRVERVLCGATVTL